MVTVLDEDEDLSGYEVKRCTASGAIHDSRMVEVIRGEKKLAVQVADCPLKPLERRNEEDWGHYAEWYTKYVRRDEFLLPSMATRSALTCANFTETSYLVFKERGQSNRIGFRKYGWYKKVFLEKDGTIIAEPTLTGVTKDDNAILLAHKAKCTEKNMAFMNLCTMEVEDELTFDDVKFAAGKNTVWYVNAAREAECVVFYIRMEAFKIYAKEWVDWCKEYHLKAEELGLPVIVN